MITNDEARKLSIQFRKNSLQLNTELKLFGVRRLCQKDIYNKQHDKLDKYITQQEKLMELLGLYRLKQRCSFKQENEIDKKIAILESELK